MSDVTKSETLGQAKLATDTPANTYYRRGVRAMFVIGAAMSGSVAILGVTLWALESISHEGGYNSISSAIIAGMHVGLSLLGLMVTSMAARKLRAKGITGFIAGGYVFITGITYLELLAGFYYPRQPTKITPFESAPNISWRLQSNFRGVYAGIPLETNALGFRSSPLHDDVDDRTVRVVCLGDSITFGHAVEAKYAYPQQLAGILRGRYPQKKWQVVNTGVPGYCTFQETLQLKRCLANGIHPDLVVLLFCLNDVTEKYTTLKQFGGTGLGYQRVADGTGNDLFRAMVWLRQYSSLLTAITPTRAVAQRRQAYRVRQLWMQPDAPHIQKAWNQAEKELDVLIQLCSENDIGLLIAVTPFRQQFATEKETTIPQQRLKKFARVKHVAFADLLPRLKEQATKAHRSPESYYLDNPHLNTDGNRAVAKIIADHFHPLDSFDELISPKNVDGSLTDKKRPSTTWQKIIAGKLTE